VDDVAAIAALGEPTRRRLYAYVVRRPEPVTRDEVAAALRIPRATVAFHLDKLVAEELLSVTFERRTDRAGPGAGRPAKLYRRSDRQVAVTLPERRYELAGHLLAAALESGAEPPAHARVDIALWITRLRSPVCVAIPTTVAPTRPRPKQQPPAWRNSVE